MEKSEKFGFNLPSSNSDDIADTNQISDNFRIIDEKIPSKEDLKNIKFDVDQSYNPESPNAQSGKAVAEALKNIDISGIDVSGKMDKFGRVVNEASATKVIVGEDGKNFILYSDGSLIEIECAGFAVNCGMLRFKASDYEVISSEDGSLKLTRLVAPTNDTDAVNKSYVDEAIKNIDVSGIDVSGKMDKFGTVKKNGNNGQTIQLDTLTYLNDSNGQTVATIGMSTDTLHLNKNLGMMNKKITSLGNPTTDTDAVNKKYVDEALKSIEIKSESLNVVRTQSYPDISTFSYTEGNNDSSGYMVVEQGTIKGGILSVLWDTNRLYNFNFNIYIFDSSGKPYLHSYNEDNVVNNKGFKGDLYEPTYSEPGYGPGYGNAISPFTIQIPDECTFIISMRFMDSVSPDNSITTATQFVEWVLNGGITFTVTEKQKIIIEKNYTADINPNIKSINHRGYGDAPENTLSAYKLSKEKGFTYVECDVAFTSDGIAVLLHDSTIDRTSDGTGSIDSMTLAEARQYDFGSWKSSDYTGEQIPTFEEFINLCRNLGLYPYIELKSSGLAQNDINKLVLIVKKYGMLDKVTWISFSSSSLELIKNIIPKARLGLVVGSITQADIQTAQGLKTEGNEVFIDSYYEETTDDMVNLCVDANIPLEYWGLNTEEKVLATNSYVSGFTTDTVIAGVVLYNNAK